jgi:hypothetical protein
MLKYYTDDCLKKEMLVHVVLYFLYFPKLVLISNLGISVKINHKNQYYLKEHLSPPRYIYLSYGVFFYSSIDNSNS